MALSDAYCRVNRARGLDLLSPEDFLQSCQQMQPLDLPVKLRTFDSGVFVLQLQSQSDRCLDQQTEKLVNHVLQLVTNSDFPTLPRFRLYYKTGLHYCVTSCNIFLLMFFSFGDLNLLNLYLSIPRFFSFGC